MVFSFIFLMSALSLFSCFYINEVYEAISLDKSLAIRVGLTVSELEAFSQSPIYGVGYGG